MAEIRVEPKRRTWLGVFVFIVGLAIALALVWYFLSYRNGRWIAGAVLRL